MCRRSLPVLVCLLGALAGCASQRKQYEITFMPPPAFLENEEVPPFTDTGEVGLPPDPEILFATLRAPNVEDGKDEERYYTNDRAGEIRLGSGRIVLGRSDVTWDEARKLSILKNGTDKYPLQVADISEFGVLDRTLHPILHDDPPPVSDPEPRKRFVRAINDRLARTPVKDIYIYVHGYRVNFENPVLVAAELWHFLGYKGVFIPFAWPSHRERLAYLGDTETSRYSALFLREFLECLAEETDARRIHVLGYSAGTRMVAAALHQFALIHQRDSTESIRQRLRLGNVVLVGSDIDRGIFATYLLDGMVRVPERLTLYESPSDKALGLSRWVFGRDRAGQLADATLTPSARRFLRETDRLHLISVAQAVGFDSGNGHSYFRDSPWVSSDLLATFLYDLSPAERGLVRADDSPIWEFPPDYVDRLRAAIFLADPELARRDREAREPK